MVRLTLEALIFLLKTVQTKGFLFEIIINVLVSSFWFIWIPMLWVYDQYKYFKSYSSGGGGATLDVTIWRLQTSDSDV